MDHNLKIGVILATEITYILNNPKFWEWRTRSGASPHFHEKSVYTPIASADRKWDGIFGYAKLQAAGGLLKYIS